MLPEQSWSHQTVLVTGAGGFIGSHLAERLVALGANVRALVEYNSFGSWGWLDRSLVKNDMKIVLGDIRDPDGLRQIVKSVDVVFHLAALIAIPYSYNAPLSYIHTNIEGTLNLLQASRDAGVQTVVHTSTSEVYGTARYVPIDENHPLRGQSPYSASKIGADKIAEAFYLSFGLPIVTLRPFNTFGPRQSDRAIIPTIITQALTQSKICLGNLKPTRDLSFVADTVEGFIRAAECLKAIGQVINIGSGEEISIEDLAKVSLNLLGRNIPIICDDKRVRPPTSEVERLCADTTKAKDLLGWNPKYSLEQGLQQTIEWVEENLEQYRPSAYVI